MEIRYVTHWMAPYTSSGSATLKRGEKIVAEGNLSNPEPLGVYALPIDYQQLEMRMVPDEERTDKKYGGFHLFISTADLNNKFRLAAEGPCPKTPDDEKWPTPD